MGTVQSIKVALTTEDWGVPVGVESLAMAVSVRKIRNKVATDVRQRITKVDVWGSNPQRYTN